jgi:hypothetical protein
MKNRKSLRKKLRLTRSGDVQRVEPKLFGPMKHPPRMPGFKQMNASQPGGSPRWRESLMRTGERGRSDS